MSGDPLFLALLKRAKLPAPVAELRFAPPRRWRFDYAWPAYNLALEVEGGVWTRGRHTRGKGAIADMEKYSEAAILGWCLIRVTPSNLPTLETISLLRRALILRGWPVGDVVGKETPLDRSAAHASPRTGATSAHATQKDRKLIKGLGVPKTPRRS